MNWLHFGLILLGLYIIWFTRLLLKKKFNKQGLLFGLVHLPYLLINLVAPFRGFMDSDYRGYSMGLLDLPQGPLVPLIVGSIVISCLLIMSKSFLDQMKKGWWTFALLVDLALTILIAAPILIGILIQPSEASIQLGEYLTISGYLVALLVLAIFSGPTFYACYISGKKVLNQVRKRS